MKRILLLILGSFAFYFLLAQDYRADVQTPKGSNVVAWITYESSVQTRIYLDSHFTNSYPNAEQIKTYDNYSSSRRFNCHGYAWHMSELTNPFNEPRWIGYYLNNTDEHIYREDGSYVEVSQEIYPGKVSWASGDHSAITTSQQGWFISKWNEYPLMKHQWNDSPYGTSNLKYYRRNVPQYSISGPSTICGQATYTIENLPSGATVQWSVSNNNLTIVSGQGTGICEVKKNQSSTAQLKAEISLGTSVIETLSLKLSTEIKVSILGSTSYVGCGKIQIWNSSITCLPLDIEGPLRINWTLESKDQRFFGFDPEFTISTTCKRSTSNTVSRQPIDAPRAIYTLRLNVTFPDDTVYSAPDESFEMYGYINALNTLSPLNLLGDSDELNEEVLTVYPNPTTDMVTVELQKKQPESLSLSMQRSAKSPITSAYEIQLWSASSMVRRFTTDQPVYQVSVSGLPAGIYFVRVIKDGKTHTKKLIKR